MVIPRLAASTIALGTVPGVLLVLLACSAGRDHASAANSPGAGESAAGEGIEQPSRGSGQAPGHSLDGAGDVGPPVSETVARALLSRRFRAAGLRIRHDVTVRGPAFEFTADGYDPQAAVGFEYVDPRERDVDLLAAERRALAGDTSRRVLIVDPVSAARLLELADAFLARLETEQRP